MLPMNTPENLEQLPRIGTDISEDLRYAIQTVVAARREADDWRGSAAARVLAMCIGNNNRQQPTLTPLVFGRAILPFWGDLNDLGEPIQANIPLNQTVGESWRWNPRNAPEIAHNGNIDEFRAFLLHPDRAAGDGTSRATVRWVRPLGLFLSCEGKNRIAFLASLGEEWVPAEVTPCGYPAAADLTLYEVEEGGEVVVVCVKENRYAVIVHHPAWTLPVLRAYGVQTGRALMCAPEVLAGIRRGESAGYGRRTAARQGFDMTTLQTPEEERRGNVPQSLAAHGNLSVSYRSILWPWITTILMFCVGAVLTLDGFLTTSQQMIGSAMLIGSISAIAGFLICLHKVKVSISFELRTLDRRK
jgi:hypothetical protein